MKALRALADEVAHVDALLVAATHGRGVDSHGEVLRDLDEHVTSALKALVLAGRQADRMLAAFEPADEYQEEGSGLRMILPALPAKPLSGGTNVPPKP